MKINNIFKVISIVNLLLLPSQLYAADDIQYGKTDLPDMQAIKYITYDGNIKLDQGLFASNNKLYPELSLYGINIVFTENSNIDIGKCNELSLNNCNIIINGNITCSGDINLMLNGSCLALNNTKSNISLLEKYKSKITLNNSYLSFNSIPDNTIELFSNPDSYPKIVLNNCSSILFNNNVIMNLNEKGKVVLSENSLLGCSNGKINLGAGKLTANRSKCNFINNATLQVELANMKLNDNSILECLDSNINFKDGTIDNDSNINYKTGTIHIDDSTGGFINSHIDLGSGIIDIANSGSDKISIFELRYSTMQSDSEDCQFRLSSRNKFILDNSNVECFGRFIKSNNKDNESDSDAPIIILDKSSAVWRSMNCNQEALQLDVQGDSPSYFGTVDSILDNMKN
ncbi:MAG: hypothetical protein IJU54_00440 [Alphaproteobacteria bacterium]|nr:hypothetical protein [Alphaproteobacteria bacterium]